jgi:hypothetical protein
LSNQKLNWSERRRIHLICERQHLRLVLKRTNSSPERCDSACKHLHPQNPGRVTVPGAPFQAETAPFPPSSLYLERVPLFWIPRIPERAKASNTCAQRLTRVEIPKLRSDQNRLTALLRTASSRLTLRHSVFPLSFGIQGLTAPKVWYAKCLSIMREEERHAEDFRG